MKKQKMWTYKGQPISVEETLNYYGFVYIIHNHSNGRSYIGRKYFTKASYKTVKGKRKKIRKASDWETYWGSNKKLLEDIKTICTEVDKFWQKCPMSNHYLHPDYVKDWPSPWQLLSDNMYCYYGRALGMIYTLLLLGQTDVELVEAKDDNSNDVVLVLVDNAKYVLNYWPDTVVNNQLKDFTVTKSIDITILQSKIG